MFILFSVGWFVVNFGANLVCCFPEIDQDSFCFGYATAIKYNIVGLNTVVKDFNLLMEVAYSVK